MKIAMLLIFSLCLIGCGKQVDPTDARTDHSANNKQDQRSKAVNELSQKHPQAKPWELLFLDTTLQAQRKFPPNTVILLDARLDDLTFEDGKIVAFFSGVFLELEVEIPNSHTNGLLASKRYDDWALAIKTSRIGRQPKVIARHGAEESELEIEREGFFIHGQCLDAISMKR